MVFDLVLFLFPAGWRTPPEFTPCVGRGGDRFRARRRLPCEHHTSIGVNRLTLTFHYSAIQREKTDWYSRNPGVLPKKPNLGQDRISVACDEAT
jgi:hypothetical protein